ncbi:unnamed protein product [Parascedosporium putredinis]|uniref:SGS-domain-containing protein n=1 Tax=Parascedosporium putredinis TaxID=1442378 RepID=A0A9P1MAX6_9PEZI|nr:unnamed protein product [Parascedosporium putredinis]CAI7994918.1 unnamed protein product [Parascedosporium putredinis]
MSAVTLGQRGLDAVESRDWDAAIRNLTLALKSSSSPKWLLGRSTALNSTGDAAGALTDAELAFHVAGDRGNRELMMEAQYRRGVALVRQNRYADADGEDLVARLDGAGDYNVTSEEVEREIQVAREAQSAKMNRGGAQTEITAKGRLETRCAAMRIRCLKDLERSPEGHPGRKVTITPIPTRPDGPAKLDAEPTSSRGAVAKATPAPSTTPAPLRIDAYETDAQQTISVFVKNVDASSFQVQWPAANLLNLKFNHGGLAEDVTLQLGGDAVPEQVTTRIISMKIELKVPKAAPAKWNVPEIHTGRSPSTESAAEPTTAASASRSIPNPTEALATRPLPPPTTAPKPSGAPAYPTSSKTGPKDWDKLEDDEDGDAETNKDPDFWFKQLYAGASDEQKRAMMKSFTESNGTALSTDWADVSKGKVETKPPEGVEAKKWD